MYGYGEIIPPDPESILEKVSEEDIFGLFIKEPIITDKKRATYVAPYRNDSNPDCYFQEHNGELFFIDFADTQTAKNCFGFVSRCINKNYRETLEYIVKNLLTNNKTLLKNTRSDKREINVGVDKVKKDRVIKFLPRNFNLNDKDFWDKYGISKDNLIEDKVIPISMYQSTSRLGIPFTINIMNDLAYAYTDFPNNRVKIYRPHGNKEQKWFTNCTQNNIGNLDNLPKNGDCLIITKSYKDCRVLRNHNFFSVWFQSESSIPSFTLLNSLCKRFNKVYVWFDNDEPGKIAVKSVVDTINSIIPKKSSSLSFEDEYCKDPSDYLAKYGEKEFKKLLKKLNLI